MRKRIYVAGPISSGDLRKNIQQAKDAGIALIRLGFAPLVPHLSVYFRGDFPERMPCGTTHEDWVAVDLPWVAVTDAVFRLPGESVGADMEVALASSLGIPVFSHVVDVKQHFAEKAEVGQQSQLVKTGTDRRRAALAEIEKCVCRDRQSSYGDAEENFADIATIWSILLREKLELPITASDVAACCAAIKLARIRTSPSHKDNWIDLGGYAVCGAGIIEADNQK